MLDLDWTNWTSLANRARLQYFSAVAGRFGVRG